MKFIFLILLLFHCSDIKKPPLYSLLFSPPAVANSNDTIAVLTSDFGAAGRLKIIQSETQIASPNFTPIHSDATSRYYLEKIYVINRLNRDNIQVINPSLAYLTIQEFSVGAKTNPSDIAIVNSEKAYISRYNSADLLIVNPGIGSAIGTINLSNYADSDGIPEMNKMYLDGNSLYLQLQRLSRNDSSGYYPPTDYSLLVEIDVTKDQVVGTYQFKSKNPFSKMFKVNINSAPHLVMAVPNRIGFISAVDGGVEGFNLNTKQFMDNLLISESEVNGDILEVQVKDDDLGFIFVLDKEFNKYVYSFSPRTGKKISTIAYYSSTAGNISGLLYTDNGRLYVGNSSFSNPGVMIYKIENNTFSPLTTKPIDVGLRPTEMILLK